MADNNTDAEVFTGNDAPGWSDPKEGSDDSLGPQCWKCKNTCKVKKKKWLLKIKLIANIQLRKLRIG